MGYSDYIVNSTGAPPPKLKAPSQADQKQMSAVAGRVKKIWAGVRTLNDWFDSNEPAVPKEQAESRASVCAVCPKNGQGDFSRWFTKPAAEIISRQLSKLNERKLSTSQDAKLNVCEACLCPLKLKVHTPMKFIKPHISEAVMVDLKAAPDCWIVKEMAG